MAYCKETSQENLVFFYIDIEGGKIEKILTNIKSTHLHRYLFLHYFTKCNCLYMDYCPYLCCSNHNISAFVFTVHHQVNGHSGIKQEIFLTELFI